MESFPTRIDEPYSRDDVVYEYKCKAHTGHISLGKKAMALASSTLLTIEFPSRIQALKLAELYSWLSGYLLRVNDSGVYSRHNHSVCPES